MAEISVAPRRPAPAPRWQRACEHHRQVATCIYYAAKTTDRVVTASDKTLLIFEQDSDLVLYDANSSNAPIWPDQHRRAAITMLAPQNNAWWSATELVAV